MLPDLNRLKIFTHIYANRSVSKAARDLHLTQPAVSQSLRKLEKELRIPLFTRVHKKMIPTPAAERLFERTSSFITELQKEVKYLRRPLDTPYGLLRIGAPYLFGGQYLPLICNHFRFRFPTVNFQLQFGTPDTLLATLSRGELDFALTEQSTPQTSLQFNQLPYTCTTLLKENLILACSRRYYDRKVAQNLDYDNLTGLDYLSADGDNGAVNLWFKHHFRKIPYDLNFVLITNSKQSILAGIHCGMGLGIAPGHLIEKKLDSGALVMVSNRKTHLVNRLLLTELQNKEPTLTEKYFLAFLKKELVTLGF